MDNIFDSISSDIFVSFFFHCSLNVSDHSACSIQGDGRSLLTWIVSFYQELQAGSQFSPKDAWLLVCSCVRSYFKALRKIRAPTQAASNMSSKSNRAGAYFWFIAQSHRVSRVFVSHRWRKHLGVSGVINYHFFRFAVPLNAHNRLKLGFEVIQKLDKDR